MKKETGEESKRAAKCRRGFPKALGCFLSVLFLVTLVCCAVITASALYGRTHYKISFYQETSQKVNSNVRLAVISDLHNREYGEHNETLISDLRALKPDLILFLGDMVIREQDDYTPMLDLVSASAEIAPCYGVLGNHESERIYYREDRDLPGRFEKAGLKLLRNVCDTVRIGDNTIGLFGLEGTAYGFEHYGGRDFMEKTEIDPCAYAVVMAHVPILFGGRLSDYDFDLGLAGHVHGGIVRLPFIGGLYTDEEGFFPKLTKGKYVLNNRQSLIISAGLGDSKVFPPRINNAPELVVIDINRY